MFLKGFYWVHDTMLYNQMSDSFAILLFGNLKLPFF